MKAILLAGGLGKRLRPLTDTMPKPMVPVAGKPILQWQIEWLQSYGVSSVVLSLGYLAEQVREHFGDGGKMGVELDYVVEEEALGTGGALRKALEDLSIDQQVYVTNGDVLTNLDPRRMEKRRVEGGLMGGIALVRLPSPYGVVEVDEGSRVRSFLEKPLLPDRWINAGVYTLSPEVFPYLPKKGSLEHDVFPVLSGKGQLYGYKFQECFWQSIDSHKDIEEASEHVFKLGTRGDV